MTSEWREEREWLVGWHMTSEWREEREWLVGWHMISEWEGGRGWWKSARSWNVRVEA